MNANSHYDDEREKSDDYADSIETMIDHLRDHDHAAAYLGTIAPTDDGTDFEVLAASDRDEIDNGEARMQQLAHHVIVLSDMTGFGPRSIALNIANVIENSEQFDTCVERVNDE